MAAKSLREHLWIYPYSTASESAKLLAEKCGCLRIKREGSNFHGKKGQYILPWGAGTGNYTADTGDATLLNPPELIDVSINKINWFRRMEMFHVHRPRLPTWTTSQFIAQGWLRQGMTVLARHEIDGSRGSGIEVIKKPLDFVHAPLYTIKVENVAEYRVYMFNDEVIDYRRKFGKAYEGLMIGDGIEFRIDHEPLPADVATQAAKAARALPLTVQGLDVIWDGERAYVLETNTAPYLGIQVANRYARRFQQFIDEAA